MLTKRQTQDKRLNILTEETYLKKMSIKSPLAKRQTGDLVLEPKAEKNWFCWLEIDACHGNPATTAVEVMRAVL
jgi:hypothetical protein